MYFFFIFLLAFNWTLDALYIGPEVYYIQRERKEGGKQTGPAIGIRGGFDYVFPCSIYVGTEAQYGFGRLTGKSSSNECKLKSNFHDAMIEGRLGYSFQQLCGWKFTLTPYLGGGYQMERNDFIDPSPLKIHTKITYGYVCGGFLSSFNCIWDELYFGLNFKAKYTLDAKNKVSNDPEFDDVSMKVKNEMQYRVELPLTYIWNCHFNVILNPFYEFRHYGGYINFPFDFIETKLNIYGATLKFDYQF